MAERWNSSIRDVVIRSIDEAVARGAATVEAEHLLLAVAADPALPGARALAEVGWDHAGIVAGLDAERAASLSVAGVEPVGPDQLAATPRTSRPGWGASARAAIKRAGIGAGRAGGRRTDTGDAAVVLGALESEVGTVPRMLLLAGVDRDVLIARLTSRKAA